MGADDEAGERHKAPPRVATGSELAETDLSTLAVGPTDLGSMASAFGVLASAPTPRPARIARGAEIDGVYRVEDTIGEGGMGVVYRARDLRLARDVAIKIGIAASPEALARAGREALALARLSHPNVVIVYQVGELDHRLYIAMEYVAGGSARDWARAGTRSWREVVALYAAAGDGLAAAHAAGLVHRDFKPDNVLVGDDGRPRVGDFGLAREHAAIEAPRGDAGAAVADVTVTGAVLGTLAYMPPEQLAGVDVDARADQFAFCVSLWEALFGLRPFAGTSASELVTSIEQGDLRTGDGPSPPAHVVAALGRGLQAAPEDRWPSMEDLLAALRREPGARRRRVTFALALTGALALATGALLWPRADPLDACAAGASQIDRAWSPAQATAVRATLGGAADHVIGALDDHARRWQVQYRVVCGAGARGWSPAQVARGMSCLASRRDQLGDTSAVLVSPGISAAHVESLIAALERPEACGEAAYLAAEVPPPTDPARAAAVEGAQRALARAHRELVVGDDRGAAIIDAAVLASAIGLDYAPLTSAALELRGELEAERNDYRASFASHRDAYFRAHEVRASSEEARAAANAAVALLDLSRFEEAGDWARLADDAARGVADAQQRAQILIVRSMVAGDTSDAAHGIDLASQAIALAGPTGQPLLVAKALQARARAAAGLAHPGAAVADLRQARALVERNFGSEHSDLILLDFDLGMALSSLGEDDEAISVHRRMMALAERLQGPDSLHVGEALSVLGAELRRVDRSDEALAAFDRAIPIMARTQGAHTFDLAATYVDRGLLLTDLQRYDAAAESYQRAIAIETDLLGADDREVAIAWANLGQSQFLAGRLAAAQRSIDEALRIWSKIGRDHPDSAYPLNTSGRIRAARHDLAGARADLERALALRQAPDMDPVQRGNTEIYLAEVELLLGHRPRAVELAHAAAHDFQAGGVRPNPTDVRILDEVLGKGAARIH